MRCVLYLGHENLNNIPKSSNQNQRDIENENEIEYQKVDSLRQYRYSGRTCNKNKNKKFKIQFKSHNLL